MPWSRAGSSSPTERFTAWTSTEARPLIWTIRSQRGTSKLTSWPESCKLRSRSKRKSQLQTCEISNQILSLIPSNWTLANENYIQRFNTLRRFFKVSRFLQYTSAGSLLNALIFHSFIYFFYNTKEFKQMKDDFASIYTEIMYYMSQINFHAIQVATSHARWRTRAVTGKKIFRNDVKRISLASKYSKVSKIYKYGKFNLSKLKLLYSPIHQKIPFSLWRVYSPFTAKRLINLFLSSFVFLNLILSSVQFS